MFLKKIAIINFKSCKNIILDLKKDSPSVFIGPNDSGKSVILESINCLLNAKNLDFQSEGKITSDISNTPISEIDFNNIFERLKLPFFSYDPKAIFLIGVFENEISDDSEYFNDNASNHLKWSRESFSDDIVLLKKYSVEKNGGDYFLCVKDQYNLSEASELWNATQATLNKLIKDLNISNKEIENVSGDGRYKNVEKFKAIYGKIDTDYFWKQYNSFNKDKNIFPTFRYFDSRVSMDDIKGIAKDVLNSRVESYKKELIKEANKISLQASASANDELAQLSKEIFSELNGVKKIKMGVNFNVQENVSDIIIEKDFADGGIRLESQGDGIKKQIWLSFIKWKSAQQLKENEKSKKFIWCFDEPEIHLFPKAQRDLFDDIKKISKGIVQGLVCTHSTIFIDKFDFGAIRQISLNDGYSIISGCDNIDDIHQSLGVKNSDIFFHDKFFVIEGDTDLLLLPHFYKLIFKKNTEEDNIQIINLKGKDNRKNNLNIFNQILHDFRKSEDFVYYFFDGDSELKKNDNVCIIGKYDLEDSISDEIWIKLVKKCCGINLSKKLIEDMRTQLNSDSSHKFYKLLADKVVCHEENKDKKYLPSKGEKLAVELASLITLVEDVPNEIRTFLEKIK